jgi:coenzyme F420 hydrogenase subunit beta
MDCVFKKTENNLCADINHMAIGKIEKCYIGFSTDPDLRRNASSGGIAGAIASFLLDSRAVDGVVSTSMHPDSPFDTRPVFCRTKEDFIKTSGSKYCPTATNAIIREDSVFSCGSLAWIGLPCQIQGLNKAKKYKPLNKSKSIVTIGLLCGGMRGQEATKWVIKSRKYSLDSVKSIKYRGDGWPGGMRIEFNNGTEPLRIPYSEYYDEYFESWQPRRCSLCLDRFSQMADIALGDAWLPELKGDIAGTSLIITRTDKGDKVVREASEKGLIKITEKDYETIIRSQQGLIADISNIIVPTVLLYKKAGVSTPEYCLDNFNISIGKYLRIIKRFARMALLRKMTLSQKLFNFVHFVKT